MVAVVVVVGGGRLTGDAAPSAVVGLAAVAVEHPLHAQPFAALHLRGGRRVHGEPAAQQLVPDIAVPAQAVLL